MYPGNNLLRRYMVISVVALAGLSMLLSACSTAGVREQGRQVSSKDSNRAIQGEAKIPLNTLAQVSDQDLAQERGCYGGSGFDRYYFGMDIGINIRRGVPTRITSKFVAEVPAGSRPASFNQATLTANYSNGPVTYFAGVAGGTGTLGKGFAQVIAVAGQNNIVIANTNININIDSLTGLSPKYNALRTATGGVGMH